MLGNERVGAGCISRIDPEMFCSGTKIGQGNIYVCVEQCLKDVDLRTLPTMDASELRGAIWSLVRWPKVMLMPFGESISFGETMEHTVGQSSHMEPIVMDAIPVTSLESDIKTRESWKNQNVLLWDENKTQIMYKGLILYVLPENCVNFEQLGENCVGVAVERIVSQEHASENGSTIDSINLIKWPIKQITMLDESPLQ